MQHKQGMPLLRQTKLRDTNDMTAFDHATSSRNKHIFRILEKSPRFKAAEPIDCKGCTYQ